MSATYEIRPFSASAAVLACITFHRSPIIASRASLTDALRQDLYRKEELAQLFVLSSSSLASPNQATPTRTEHLCEIEYALCG
ncbi:hypothetical protein OUZ56_002709 [Daphnia magna]|uniref:Uncharacterized protein n=1 Tax=Daphnia magna TaxID=35525 RepID=A0ABR0A6T3_9CRUS|nr:hypothetical protein OUZ56_002709 [Daphnia magna]